MEQALIDTGRENEVNLDPVTVAFYLWKSKIIELVDIARQIPVTVNSFNTIMQYFKGVKTLCKLIEERYEHFYSQPHVVQMPPKWVYELKKDAGLIQKDLRGWNI